MKKLTKKYVIENTSIRKALASNGSTLRGCGFETTTFDLMLNDRLYDNMIRWGWIEDKGHYVITWEGLCNLKMV